MSSLNSKGDRKKSRFSSYSLLSRTRKRAYGKHANNTMFVNDDSTASSIFNSNMTMPLQINQQSSFIDHSKSQYFHKISKNTTFGREALPIDQPAPSTTRNSSLLPMTSHLEKKAASPSVLIKQIPRAPSMGNGDELLSWIKNLKAKAEATLQKNHDEEREFYDKLSLERQEAENERQAKAEEIRLLKAEEERRTELLSQDTAELGQPPSLAQQLPEIATATNIPHDLGRETKAADYDTADEIYNATDNYEGQENDIEAQEISDDELSVDDEIGELDQMISDEADEVEDRESDADADNQEYSYRPYMSPYSLKSNAAAPPDNTSDEALSLSVEEVNEEDLSDYANYSSGKDSDRSIESNMQRSYPVSEVASVDDEPESQEVESLSDEEDDEISANQDSVEESDIFMEEGDKEEEEAIFNDDKPSAFEIDPSLIAAAVQNTLYAEQESHSLPDTSSKQSDAFSQTPYEAIADLHHLDEAAPDVASRSEIEVEGAKGSGIESLKEPESGIRGAEELDSGIEGAGVQSDVPSLPPMSSSESESDSEEHNESVLDPNLVNLLESSLIKHEDSTKIESRSAHRSILVSTPVSPVDEELPGHKEASDSAAGYFGDVDDTDAVAAEEASLTTQLPERSLNVDERAITHSDNERPVTFEEPAADLVSDGSMGDESSAAEEYHTVAEATHVDNNEDRGDISGANLFHSVLEEDLSNGEPQEDFTFTAEIQDTLTNHKRTFDEFDPDLLKATEDAVNVIIGAEESSAVEQRTDPENVGVEEMVADISQTFAERTMEIIEGDVEEPDDVKMEQSNNNDDTDDSGEAIHSNFGVVDVSEMPEYQRLKTVVGQSESTPGVPDQASYFESKIIESVSANIQTNEVNMDAEQEEQPEEFKQNLEQEQEEEQEPTKEAAPEIVEDSLPAPGTQDPDRTAKIEDAEQEMETPEKPSTGDITEINADERLPENDESLAPQIDQSFFHNETFQFESSNDPASSISGDVAKHGHSSGKAQNEVVHLQDSDQPIMEENNDKEDVQTEEPVPQSSPVENEADAKRKRSEEDEDQRRSASKRLKTIKSIFGSFFRGKSSNFVEVAEESSEESTHHEVGHESLAEITVISNVDEAKGASQTALKGLILNDKTSQVSEREGFEEVSAQESVKDEEQVSEITVISNIDEKYQPEGIVAEEAQEEQFGGVEKQAEKLADASIKVNSDSKSKMTEHESKADSGITTKISKISSDTENSMKTPLMPIRKRGRPRGKSKNSAEIVLAATNSTMNASTLEDHAQQSVSGSELKEPAVATQGDLLATEVPVTKPKRGRPRKKAEVPSEVILRENEEEKSKKRGRRKKAISTLPSSPPPTTTRRSLRRTKASSPEPAPAILTAEPVISKSLPHTRGRKRAMPKTTLKESLATEKDDLRKTEQAAEEDGAGAIVVPKKRGVAKVEAADEISTLPIPKRPTLGLKGRVPSGVQPGSPRHITMRTRSGKFVGANTSVEIANQEEQEKLEEEMIFGVASGDIKANTSVSDVAQLYDEEEIKRQVQKKARDFTIAEEQEEPNLLEVTGVDVENNKRRTRSANKKKK